MAITPKAGAVADSGGSQTTSQAITIPACAAGDILLVFATQLPISTTVPALSISSTGTAPQSAAAQVSASESSVPAVAACRPWYVVAGASETGKVITVSSTEAGFWALSVVPYSGVDNTTPVDVSANTSTGASAASVTSPSATTVTDQDWPVSLFGGAAEGVSAPAVSSGTTREGAFSSVNVISYNVDPNAAATPAGTSIGGITLTPNSATNSIFVAFTLGLKPAGGPVVHSGSAALSGTGTLGASGSVGTPGSAALTGTGSLSAADSGTRLAAAALSGTGTLTAAATAAPFEAVFTSVDGNGVQTWTVTSPYNGPSTSVLRIKPPDSPAAGVAHSFMYGLPVSTGTDATFGDPFTVICQDLGAHNTHNFTLVVPSFPIQPWYADNPDNADQQQESFMLALAEWMAGSEFASGGEVNRLISFSKGGIGGQGLLFHHPEVWAACASWDAPFMMTGLNGDGSGIDAVFGSSVGGDPGGSYGTSGNFAANYELSTGNLTAWNTAAGGKFTSVKCVWAGGYQAFQDDVAAYEAELDGLGFLADTSWSSAAPAHAWDDNWVGDALAAIMAMPEQAAAAALTGTGTLGASGGPVTPGSAALAGTGTLTAAGLRDLAAAAALAGAGTLTAAGTRTQPGPAAALTGTGVLAGAGAADREATAALSGTGTLTAARATVAFGTARAGRMTVARATAGTWN